MRILRLTTALDFGGVERRLVTISHVRDENEWLFCAIGNGGEAEAKIRQQNKFVFSFNRPHRIPSLGTIYHLYVFFKKAKPTVVHTSGAEANFHGVLAAKLAGVPRVVSEEIGIPSQSRAAQAVFSFIYRLSDYVIGNSEPVTDYLKTKNKVPERKLRQIPNPMVFPELSQKEKAADGVFRIISVSRLEPVKNIASVLRVIARLIAEGQDVHYTIVGDGTHRDQLESCVNELSISEYVTFTGFQSNPFSFLPEADLYVLSSFTEGFSNSLLEAMYSGTPSLSTRVGAAEEIIADGENGWLVNPGDDDALYRKIEEIRGTSLCERMKIGEKGKKTVEENYSLDRHIALLMESYTE